MTHLTGRVDPAAFGAGRHFTFDLAVRPDDRGKLAVIEIGETIPFEIHRTYHVYDIPAGAERGGHAHRDLDQILIAVSGSFEVHVVSASGGAVYTLNTPGTALYIGSWVWRDMRNFSSSAVCFVLASHHYDEADYIRSFDHFKKLIEP
jgi:oxalate decarboxylase/phosphoglucose isomerase-like protein (cupin superfamily)